MVDHRQHILGADRTQLQRVDWHPTIANRRERREEGVQPPVQREVRPALPQERALQGAGEEVGLPVQEEAVVAEI